MNSQLSLRSQKMSSFYVMEVLKRAQQLEAQGRDVIHMEIGEPDFPTPSPIIEASLSHISTGAVKYTAAAGLPQLREKIVEFYQQRYAVKLAKERVFITPGASGAFLLALGVSLNPGDELLLADPCYPCNNNIVRFFDGTSRCIPVDEATQFQLNARLIEQHWCLATKGVLIASPSNPTGTLIVPEQLKMAIEKTHSLGGQFYSDEIYHGLVYGNEAATALSFSDDVFVINSFSKYFGMTGWRIGWLIVPEGYVEAVEKLAQNVFISTSTSAQFAAMAAFEPATMLELERRRAEFASRREFLYDSLLSLGFDIPCKPEGAFYIYVNAAKFTQDSYQFALDLLEVEALAITPGKDFGEHNAQHMLRFAYTTSTDRIAVAMQRLKNYLNHIG
ncbi:MAG: aminotransferase class I/II-fold pyridoxal phosphate-dependent enzyme [Methylococcaceae bacterium]